jgi:hypothetical protein
MEFMRRVGAPMTVTDPISSAMPEWAAIKLQWMHVHALNNAKGSRILEYRVGVRGGKITMEQYLPQPYLQLERAEPRENLGRLRMGAHLLRVETGRWSEPITPRADRVCRHCSLGEVEDVHHLLFRCSAYEAIRQEDKYTCLFTRPWDNVHFFMEHEAQGKVSSFALKCCQRRDQLEEALGTKERGKRKRRKRNR